jgi:hypothetical protein
MPLLRGHLRPPCDRWLPITGRIETAALCGILLFFVVFPLAEVDLKG